MRASPPVVAPAVLVTAVGTAAGSRAAAGALACAGADLDRATLLLDFGARPPRPTLLASAAAQRLEERLASHLPDARLAARGRVCHLAAGDGDAGMELARAAATVARDELRVLHAEPAAVQALLDSPLGEVLSGALLRADLPADRSLLALAVRDLLARRLAVAVLKHRLPWIAERRALFGALPPDAAGALPPSIPRKLLSATYCYGGGDAQRISSEPASR